MPNPVRVMLAPFGVRSIRLTPIYALGSRLTVRQRTYEGPSARRLLDELDLVAVGILDEGDHAAAELHRPRLARHLPALCLHRVARLVRVGHRDREMSEAVAEVIGLGVPVVRELDH